MKVLITESQLNDIIPTKIKRNFNFINDSLDNLLYSKGFTLMSHNFARRETFEDFLDNMSNFIMSHLTKDADFEYDHEDDEEIEMKGIKLIIHDKAKKFWEEVNK